MNNVALFLRIFDKESYFNDFMGGRIYMNSFANLRKIEDGEVRGDRNEGARGLTQFKEMAIRKDESSDFVPIKGARSPLIHFDSKLRGNILCFYMLQPERIPDASIQRFGAYACILKNPASFFEKLKIAAKSSGRDMCRKPVRYLDFTKHHGPLCVFDKSDIYLSQNEFRCFMASSADEPVMLDIGRQSNNLFVDTTENIIKSWHQNRHLVKQPEFALP